MYIGYFNFKKKNSPPRRVLGFACRAPQVIGGHGSGRGHGHKKSQKFKSFSDH
jgi:hypothetical protein